MKIAEFKVDKTYSANKNIKNSVLNSNIASTIKSSFINNKILKLKDQDSYLSVPHFAGLNSISDNLQIEIIFKYLDIGGNFRFLIDKDNSYNIEINDEIIIISYIGSNGTRTHTFNIASEIYNNWVYLLIQIDLSIPEINLYVNSVQKNNYSSTGAHSLVIDTSANNIYLGAKSTIANSTSVKHYLDYFAIYDSIFTNTERENRFNEIQNYISYKYNSYLERYYEKIICPLDFNSVKKIGVFNSDGTEINKINSDINVIENYPSYNNINKKILHTRYISGYDQIFSVEINGDNLTQITTDNSDKKECVWIDTDNILFNKLVSGKDHIFKKNLRTNIEIDITSSVTDNYSFPRVSPDQNKILLTLNESPNYGIYTIDLDGNNLTDLSIGGTEPSHGSWNNSGDKIIYRDFDGFYDQIYIMDNDGNNKTVITSNNIASKKYPIYSPDESKILYLGDENTLRIIDINTLVDTAIGSISLITAIGYSNIWNIFKL